MAPQSIIMDTRAYESSGSLPGRQEWSVCCCRQDALLVTAVAAEESARTRPKASFLPFLRVSYKRRLASGLQRNRRSECRQARDNHNGHGHDPHTTC